MKENNYAVLGLGRYGLKVADTISNTGVTVLVADPDIDKIDSVGNRFTTALSFDMTNVEALRDIGLENIDVVIIDLAGDLEGSIMCTMVAMECGVDRIIATAANNRAGEVLKKLGADEIVIPEEESALRLAKSLISANFVEFTDLGGDLCIVKLHAKKEWDNKSLRALNLHAESGITVIAVYMDDGLSADFNADYVINAGDPIILAMKKETFYDFV